MLAARRPVRSREFIPRSDRPAAGWRNGLGNTSVTPSSLRAGRLSPAQALIDDDRAGHRRARDGRGASARRPRRSSSASTGRAACSRRTEASRASTASTPSCLLGPGVQPRDHPHHQLADVLRVVNNQETQRICGGWLSSPAGSTPGTLSLTRRSVSGRPATGACSPRSVSRPLLRNRRPSHCRVGRRPTRTPRAVGLTRLNRSRR